MRQNDLYPADSSPELPDIDPDEVSINPFAGGQALEHRPTELNLGGNALNQAGILIPGESDATSGSAPETISNAEQAAKKACGLIAEMYIKQGNPESIIFPMCDDIGVVSHALRQLGNTPLGLGYGAFPDAIPKAWGRFLNETTANYRKRHGLEVTDLVPLKIDQLPDWLDQNPTFDILAGCELMDITIQGPVKSVIASDAKYCRFRFTEPIQPGGCVGEGAIRSTFIFDADYTGGQSFKGATNVSIEFKGIVSNGAVIGPVSASYMGCGGSFRGVFKPKRGTGCEHSRNISYNNITEV